MKKMLVVLFSLFACFALAAEPGIPVDTHFRVPLVVNGKTITAKAFVSADKTLHLFYAVDGEVESIAYSIARKDVSPEPTPPTPEPKPDPKPTPKPADDIAYIYVVHDTATDKPAQATVIDGAKWQAEAKARGIPWITVTPKEGAAKFPVIIAKAQAAGLPCVVSLDKSLVATVRPLPESDDAFVALVKGGAK